MFQRLPFHHLEIAKLLFVNAKEAAGRDMLKVLWRMCRCACVTFTPISPAAEYALAGCT